MHQDKYWRQALNEEWDFCLKHTNRGGYIWATLVAILSRIFKLLEIIVQTLFIHILLQHSRCGQIFPLTNLFLSCISLRHHGITFGVKHVLGDHVHWFFTKSIASPFVLFQLMSGSQEAVSVYDYGLDNKTEADNPGNTTYVLGTAGGSCPANSSICKNDTNQKQGGRRYETSHN